MKKLLFLSLVGNVFLGAMVLLFRLHSGGAPPMPAAGVGAHRREVETEPVVAPAGRPPPSPAFRWSQVESSDYPTYIGNLRAIGCPEETIRDIIKADVAALYASKRRQLERGAGTGGSERDGLDGGWGTQSALQQLRREEAGLIRALLGPEPTPEPANDAMVAADASRAERRGEREARLEEAPVSAPLVLQSVDPAALKLSDEQAATIAELRQSFIEQIGGPNQDPGDPAYRRRWQAAQRRADEMMAAFLGRGFRLKYQMALEAQGQVGR